MIFGQSSSDLYKARFIHGQVYKIKYISKCKKNKVILKNMI